MMTLQVNYMTSLLHRGQMFKGGAPFMHLCLCSRYVIVALANWFSQRLAAPLVHLQCKRNANA